jgi:hypothetical protein
MRRFCHIASKKQHGLASERSFEDHRQGPFNSPPGVTPMMLDKVWETGWIQATILLAAVVAAMVAAFTVKL